jgi:F-type H+-transporting ATPase subunit delta
MERSITGTWAAGILAHARSIGRQNRWSSTLTILDNLVANPVFARMAFQTNLDRHELYQLVMQLAGDLFLPDEQNFIKLLIRYRRLRLIGRIRKRYEELRDIDAGLVRVLLITASPLDGSSYERLLPALNQHFGSGMKPHFHLDPDLMGGIIIRTGDQVLDLSVKTRLTRLSRSLRA